MKEDIAGAKTLRRKKRLESRSKAFGLVFDSYIDTVFIEIGGKEKRQYINTGGFDIEKMKGSYLPPFSLCLRSKRYNVFSSVTAISRADKPTSGMTLP